jgi:hypothetical protein
MEPILGQLPPKNPEPSVYQQVSQIDLNDNLSQSLLTPTSYV